MSSTDPQTTATQTSLVNVTEWPSFNAYTKLDAKAREIRVLTLLGRNDDGILECSMSHASLLQNPEYAALSYYWGAPVAKTELLPIIIDDTAISIRPTLHQFLTTLNAQVGQLTFWLDVVCINQDNTEERNNQVSMMGDIFADAVKVYAWLGGGDADTSYAFGAFNGTLNSSYVDDKLLAEYAEQIMLRPYWTRMWVIQEFVKAQDILLVCGDKIAQWNHLRNYLARLSLKPYSEAHKRFSSFDGARRSYLAPDSSDQQDDLYSLIETFRDSRCVDRRDRVYALLGLSSERDLVNADYSVTVGDVSYKLLSLHAPMTAEPLCMHLGRQKFLYRPCNPWEASSRIDTTLALPHFDLIESLRPRQGDRLYSWFTLIGRIGGLTPQATLVDDLSTSAWRRARCPGDDWAALPKPGYVVTFTDGNCWLYANGMVLRTGDAIYETRPFQMERLGLIYLVIRPETNEIVDVVPMMEPFISSIVFDFERVRRLCMPGMTICSTSWSHRAKSKNLLLVHLTRVAHFVLSLKPKEMMKQEIRDRLDREPVWPAPECTCVSLQDEIDDTCKDQGVSSVECGFTCFTTVKMEKSLKPMWMYNRSY